MKKILSVFAAAAVLFGFASCNGELHDKEISPLYIEGTCWTTREALEIVDDTTQKKTFTYEGQTGWEALANEVHFKIIATPAGWTDDFGGSDTETITLTVNDDFAETHSRKVESLPDTKHIVLAGLDVGTEYTIYIRFTASENKVEVKYEGPDPVPVVDMSIISGSDISQMDMIEKNSSYQASFVGDGNNYSFKIYDGTDSYGLSTAGTDVSSATKLVKDGSKITVSTMKNVEYLISVNRSDDDGITVQVQPALLCYKEGITYINSNCGNYQLDWVVASDGSYATAKVTVPKGTTPGDWGKGDAVTFGVCKGKDDWSIKYTGANIGAGGFTDLKKGADDNNYAEGFKVADEDIIIVVKSTKDTLSAKVESASVTAASDVLCFKEPLCALNSNCGNYSLAWRPAEKAGEWKATVVIPAGTEAADWGVANSICFGICNDSSWGVKYTGGAATKAGTLTETTKAAAANNTIAALPTDNDVVITVIATSSSVSYSF